MSDDIFEEAEIDLDGLGPGKELEKRPKGMTSAELSRLPDKLTAEWVGRQLPKKDWQKNQSVLNPQLIVHMHKDIRKGLSQRAVCARSGISTQTWWMWERKAAEEVEPYATWYRCMLHGVALLEDELIDHVRTAAGMDWKAATWLLGKINRDEYADTKGAVTTNVRIEGDVGNKQTINSLDESEATKIANLMAKIGALPPATVVDAEVVEDED